MHRRTLTWTSSPMTDLLSILAHRPTEDPQPMMLSATRAKSFTCRPSPAESAVPCTPQLAVEVSLSRGTELVRRSVHPPDIVRLTDTATAYLLTCGQEHVDMCSRPITQC